MRKRKEEREDQYQSGVYLDGLRSLAKNLRVLREQREWTQEEAAAECSMLLRHYQRVEGEESNVTLTTLARLAVGFGVELEVLLSKSAPRKTRRS